MHYLFEYIRKRQSFFPYQFASWIISSDKKYFVLSVCGFISEA